MTWRTHLGVRLWGWKRYWLVPLLLFATLLSALALTDDTEPQHTFEYATF
jgi:hypothetical protein